MTKLKLIMMESWKSPHNLCICTRAKETGPFYGVHERYSFFFNSGLPVASNLTQKRLNTGPVLLRAGSAPLHPALHYGSIAVPATQQSPTHQQLTQAQGSTFPLSQQAVLMVRQHSSGLEICIHEPQSPVMSSNQSVPSPFSEDISKASDAPLTSCPPSGNARE